jgi:GNAT superfamily N-acetyltransferase
VVIRSYRARDLDPLAAMWHASKRAAFSYVAAQQAYTIDDDRGYLRDSLTVASAVWLAEVDAEIAGFMAIKCGVAPDASGAALIDQLFVAVGRQRTGIGSTLLAIAKRLFPTGLRLYTFQRNSAARAFYEARGFVAVRFGMSPPPDDEPDVEYQWRPGCGNHR